MMSFVDADDGFVSIDLNDDTEECDICHQATEEKIVRVILSDEFTLFEGSYEKYSGNLTKAHQICLHRWANIIKRNLKVTGRSNSPQLQEKHNHYESEKMKADRFNDNVGKTKLSKDNNKSAIINNRNYKENVSCVHVSGCIPCTCDQSIVEKNKENVAVKTNHYIEPSMHSCSKMLDSFSRLLERQSQEQLSQMNCENLRQLVSKLETLQTEFSNTLVGELQLLDKLRQEVSGQNSLIAQLVKLQRKNSLPKTSAVRRQKQMLT